MVDYKICIVIPAYNEEDRLSVNYFTMLAAIPHVYFLFVDDGSSDATLKTLNLVSSELDNFGVLSLKNNVGKGDAVRAGWIEVHKKYQPPLLGFLDADGAFECGDVEKMVQISLAKMLSITNQSPIEFQSVWSARIALSGRVIQRTKSRFLLGRILAGFLKILFSDLPWDTQSGFKIFRNSAEFRKVLNDNFSCRWLFDLELLLKLRRASISGHYHVWEEPLDSWRDIPDSKVGLRGYLSIIRESILIIYKYSKRGLVGEQRPSN
jgi:glycosyltransferase involved in cell wall biosynthesis